MIHDPLDDLIRRSAAWGTKHIGEEFDRARDMLIGKILSIRPADPEKHMHDSVVAIMAAMGSGKPPDLSSARIKDLKAKVRKVITGVEKELPVEPEDSPALKVARELGKKLAAKAPPRPSAGRVLAGAEEDEPLGGRPQVRSRARDKAEAAAEARISEEFTVSEQLGPLRNSLYNERYLRVEMPVDP